VASFTVRSLSGLPEVAAGEDLAALLLAALRPQQDSAGSLLRDDQIVVVAQKVVSKAEGAVVHLAGVTPGEQALRIAAEARLHGVEKDPRAVQVVLDQSAHILRSERGILISRTHTGLVCANAGVDASNSAGPETLIVLPTDPDASARRLRERLRRLDGSRPGIIITDSFGRPWRNGQCDTAIGCAGVLALDDWRGRQDSVGRELSATSIAVADAIAAAADLARSKDSREPLLIVDGLGHLVTDEDGPGVAPLLRDPADDLFS
jgi:coenzyme F420-0:L-glutamate ligase / coenzyme F420-1:gamma-L-glutamate ligase